MRIVGLIVNRNPLLEHIIVGVYLGSTLNKIRLENVLYFSCLLRDGPHVLLTLEVDVMADVNLLQLTKLPDHPVVKTYLMLVHGL
jgi:hypothetical protein